MAWVYYWVPGAQVFRFPYRFAILAMVALAVPLGRPWASLELLLACFGRRFGAFWCASGPLWGGPGVVVGGPSRPDFMGPPVGKIVVSWVFTTGSCDFWGKKSANKRYSP